MIRFVSSGLDQMQDKQSFSDLISQINYWHPLQRLVKSIWPRCHLIFTPQLIRKSGITV